MREWLRARRVYRVDRLFERIGVWAFCFDGGEAFPPMQPELKKSLKQRFLPEVEELERLIGRDLSAWK